MPITPDSRKGSPCPQCGAPMGVCDTRLSRYAGLIVVRRKRFCECGYSVRTLELPEAKLPNFNEAKIYALIMKRHPEVIKTIKELLG